MELAATKRQSAGRLEDAYAVMSMGDGLFDHHAVASNDEAPVGRQKRNAPLG
jgi:hypothetical protein